MGEEHAVVRKRARDISWLMSTSDHETDLQLLPPVKLNTITCESQNPRTHVEEPDYLNIHNTHRLERV